MSSIKCHHEDMIAIAILSTDSIVRRKSYTEFQPFALHSFSLARKLWSSVLFYVLSLRSVKQNIKNHDNAKFLLNKEIMIYEWLLKKSRSTLLYHEARLQWLKFLASCCTDDPSPKLNESQVELVHYPSRTCNRTVM